MKSPLIFPLQSDNECIAGFGQGGSQQLWILGNVFIRQYYAVCEATAQHVGHAKSTCMQTQKLEDRLWL